MNQAPHRLRRRPAHRARRGLTMIDTVVSIAILLILSTITVVALGNAQKLHKLMQEREDPSIATLDTLRRHLHLAFLHNEGQRQPGAAPNAPRLDANGQLADGQAVDASGRVTYRTVFIGQDGPLDQLLFATQAHKRMYRNTRESDQAEVTLWGEPMPRIEGRPDDGYVLYMREAGRVDGEPDEGGVVRPLMYNVKEFELRYLDGFVNEWRDEWDSRGAEQMGRLPRAVEIVLVYYVVDPNDEDRVLERTQRTTVLLQFADAIIPQRGDAAQRGGGATQ